MATQMYDLWIKGSKAPTYTGEVGMCQLMVGDLMNPNNPAWAVSYKDISVVPKGEKPQFK